MKRRLRSLILLVAALCLLIMPQAALAATKSTFTWDRVSGIGWINDLTYGNGTWVLSSGKKVLRSTDGKTWEDSNLPSGQSLGVIGWAKAAFVAHAFDVDGVDGGIYTSPDGKTWTRSVTAKEVDSLSVANGQIFYTTHAGGFFTSTDDGKTWKQIGPAPLSTVVYGGGQYFAIGYRVAGIWTSSDGFTWHMELSTARPPTDLAVNGGRAVVVQEGADYVTTFYSYDANSGWQISTKPFVAVAVTNDGHGSFYLLGTGKDGVTAMTSRNGYNWTTTPVKGLERLGYVARVVVDEKFYWTWASGRLYRSTDGQTWEFASENHLRGGLQSVTWGNGRWMAAGDNGQLLSSTDGATWTKLKSPSTEDFETVAWVGDRFLLSSMNTDTLGACMKAKNCTSHVWASTDGVNWQGSVVNGSAMLYVVGKPGLYVGRDHTGSFSRSTDGLKWEPVATLSQSLSQSFAFYKDRFWSVGLSKDGAGSALFSSADGLAWAQEYQFPRGEAQISIAATESKLVVYGYAPNYYTSADGKEWTANPLPKGQTKYDLPFPFIFQVAGGKEATVGLWLDPSGFSVGPTLMKDGKDEKAHERAVSSNMSGLAYHDGLFVSVGVGGLIQTWRSAPATVVPAPAPATKP